MRASIHFLDYIYLFPLFPPQNNLLLFFSRSLIESTNPLFLLLKYSFKPHQLLAFLPLQPYKM
uniref:Uncharacterized protein n=1 Tax=Meloidogyne enterolobii TaxID=390850 RepID=A0A6V7Y2P8_MELEN|nr:unnamed protein product [Meloidogyne enterolobii]